MSSFSGYQELMLVMDDLLGVGSYGSYQSLSIQLEPGIGT